MTTINFRTKQAYKTKAQHILAELGLDMSTAMNMFLVQVIQKKGIPFPILTENKMTPESEKHILEETEDAKKNEKVYSSSKELFDDVLCEE